MPESRRSISDIWGPRTPYVGDWPVRVETLDQLLAGLDGVRGAKDPTVLDVVTIEDAPFWQVQSPLAKEGPGGE